MPRAAQQVTEEQEPMEQQDAPVEDPINPAEELEGELRFAQDPLTSDARRKLIEDKLEDIDVSQFLFQGYIQQEVGLAVPVTYRTPYTRHTLWAERMITDMVDNNVLFVEHYGRILNLAIYLVAIGEKRLPDLGAYKKEADYDSFRKAVEERIEYLQELPTGFTDDLGVNLEWFNRRVRTKLAVTGVADLKN
mgnify:CR=1 FL=1|tara:strand:- start:3338 stop:3913 length:576 start_codon:yes stop_codon:yes gene_type:complete